MEGRIVNEADLRNASEKVLGLHKEIEEKCNRANGHKMVIIAPKKEKGEAWTRELTH